MSMDDHEIDKGRNAERDVHAEALAKLEASQREMGKKYESLLSEMNMFVERAKPGSELSNKQVSARHAWWSRVRHLIFLFSCIALATGMLSYAEPRVLNLLTDNPLGLAAFAFAFLCFLILTWTAPSDRESNKKFINIDEDESAKKEWQVIFGSSNNYSGKADGAKTVSEDENNIDHPHHNRVLLSSNQAPFARYVDSVVASLDSQIQLSEKKASMLLDQGTNYLRKGIYFFVASIVAWQLLIAWIGFAPHMWVGIISCSLTFFVVEFLAAWFLKQYRSYVDSSLIYLRVRSTFNRYLLKYHAVNEYCNTVVDEAEARQLLLKALEEEIEWPELRDINKNDFNFMLETVNSFTSVVDKMKKSLFKDNGGNAG